MGYQSNIEVKQHRKYDYGCWFEVAHSPHIWLCHPTNNEMGEKCTSESSNTWAWEEYNMFTK